MKDERIRNPSSATSNNSRRSASNDDPFLFNDDDYRYPETPPHDVRIPTIPVAIRRREGHRARLNVGLGESSDPPSSNLDVLFEGLRVGDLHLAEEPTDDVDPGPTWITV